MQHSESKHKSCNYQSLLTCQEVRNSSSNKVSAQIVHGGSLSSSSTNRATINLLGRIRRNRLNLRKLKTRLVNDVDFDVVVKVLLIRIFLLLWVVVCEYVD